MVDIYENILDEKVDDKFKKQLTEDRGPLLDPPEDEEFRDGMEDNGEIKGGKDEEQQSVIDDFLRNYENSIENVLTNNLEALMKKMGPSNFYFEGPALINQIKKVTADKIDQITREFYSQSERPEERPEEEDLISRDSFEDERD